MSDSLGHKAVSGAVWASLDRVSSMVLQFAVNLILARLLMPQDFGAIGMLAIFIAVSQCLIDGGFGSALIQKKKPTQVDYSTVFYWNLIFSSFLYLVLFFLAPLIAAYFNMPILSGVLRCIGINLIISSVLAIQTTRLRKSLAFKTIAITNLSSYILGSSLAVFLAFHEFGVWSLAVMQLSYSTISISILWFITRWHPSLCFSTSTIKELFSFGGYMMAAGLLQEICKNLQGIIIGKRFSATQMGYFSQAYKLDHVSSYSIPQVIVQVMYPVYSSIQDDKKRLVEILSMNIRVISFLIFPLMTLLIIVSEPLIVGMYGEKWLPSVPYFRILCIGGLFVCLQNINFYAVAAVGKSRTLFFWSFYKWGFLLTALIVGMFFGMYGILWGMVLSNMNIYIVNAYLVSRHVGLEVWRQIKNLLPIISNIVIAIGICFIGLSYDISIWYMIPIFILIYLGASSLEKLKALSETIVLVKKLINR